MYQLSNSSPSSSDAAGEAFLGMVLGWEVNGVRPAAHRKVVAAKHLQ